MSTSPKSTTWRRPLKNAGIVGIGKGMQGVMSLLALALAARQLGVEAFGLFVLIHAMMFGVSQILRLQSWQAVLKYGAEALHDGNAERLRDLVRYCFTLDIMAGLVGTAGMVLAAGPLAGLFGLPDQQIWIAQIYSISILFILLTPTQLGVLRLFGRFDLVAWQTMIGPAVRTLGSLFLFFCVPEAGLLAYLTLWFIGGAVARQAMFVMALLVLRRENMPSGFFRPIYNGCMMSSPEPGLLRFVFGHNLGRGLNAAQDHIALVLVGGILGPAAAGLFKIAQKFSDILAKPAAKFLIPAIYPEFARFEASGDHQEKKRMIRKNMVVVGAVSVALFLVLVFAGEYLIEIFSGPDYKPAYWPMILLALAGLVVTLSYPLEPMLSAAGRVRAIILAYGVGLAVYLGLIYGFSLFGYGLIGAGLAAIFSALVSAMIMFTAVKIFPGNYPGNCKK